LIVLLISVFEKEVTYGQENEDAEGGASPDDRGEQGHADGRDHPRPWHQRESVCRGGALSRPSHAWPFGKNRVVRSEVVS